MRFLLSLNPWTTLIDPIFWKKNFVFSRFNNPSFVLLLGARASRAIHKPKVRKIFLKRNLVRDLSLFATAFLEVESADIVEMLDIFEEVFIPWDKMIVFTGDCRSIFISLPTIRVFRVGLVFLFKVTI